MAKLKITRTFGPIHFEDLDPHRFEDLVRELLYDYKDWQSIEATGRSGSDDGFDIRAYEKNVSVVEFSDDEQEENELHPMEGNMWKIQCKREQKLGPTRIEEIISDGVSKDNPPYGYILVAPANFSKKAYDIFRQELRKKGVMEFFLWGKPELEDMLHMPKYDRILFTFFGFSLVTAKRSLTTTIRSFINTKNRIAKIFGEDPRFQKVLLRDINDTQYPKIDGYKDFKQNPAWKIFNVQGYNVAGIWVEISSYMAYFDILTNEWDYSTAFDLNEFDVDDNETERVKKIAKHQMVSNFCDGFPESKKNTLSIWGLVSYKDIVIIDEKGDVLHKYPHLYLEKRANKSFFERVIQIIGGEHDKHNVDLKKYHKIKIFPNEFLEPRKGYWHKQEKIIISAATFNSIEKEYMRTLYSIEDKYPFLKSGDYVEIGTNSGTIEKIIIRLKVKYVQSVTDYLKANQKNYKARKNVVDQIGENVADNEKIYIYEFNRANREEIE